ncbi:iron-containing alcohol dehydrogenase [Xylanibacillus composti]|uniref:3-dehydroquinate synthase n=1 Tax=Xylanibacillus composti TaxID=1572762 RepID=A0A8J4H3H7_9BACL|nr:2-deoxy-scyllo-inosose synthase [Xylanibacillus composti]MDT9727122.1 iron-containing alcohol dehydrogenase [Xylanibacillus composti]GIQ68866.1 3-dehydroquinate synthase [Xylanibacillus composti]
MLERTIQFGAHAYAFLCGDGALDQFSPAIAALSADRFILIADKELPPFIKARTLHAFEEHGKVHLIETAFGEANKHLQTVQHICEQAVAWGADRRTAVVALGGGVAGNVAGMAAALLYRGLPLIHIPTTLMAASDSVLSLKQAVNLRHGKNLVGTYYTPRAVCVELTFLRTLPMREIRSGLCELVKNLLAIKPERIPEFRTLLRPLGPYTDQEMERFIDFCIDAKTEVMRHDPYERNEGLVLEYGHTVGHALELACKGRYSHGECVGFGMRCAAYIAERFGLLSEYEVRLHEDLLRQIGVKVKVSAQQMAEMEAYWLKDNKRGYRQSQPDHIGFVLLNGLGRMNKESGSSITFVPQSLVREAVHAMACSQEAVKAHGHVD